MNQKEEELLDSLPLEEMFEEFSESPSARQTWQNLLEEGSESPVIMKKERRINSRYQQIRDSVQDSGS